MTTTPSARPAPGGWNWVDMGLLPRSTVVTKLLEAWDGLFEASCPCGRDVDWDAFTFQPICTCSPMFIEVKEEST